MPKLSLELCFALFFGLIFQYLIGTEPILNCNFGQLFAILIVWGHAQIGMGIFLSMVLRKTRLEVLSAYIIMLIIMSAVPLLRRAQIIKWPYFLWLFPPTAFARSLSLVMEGAAQPHTIVTATLSMLWTSTVLGLIGIYIHYQSLYEDTGNSISKYILNNILCKCRKKNNQISHLKSTTGEASKGTDSDVLEEVVDVAAEVVVVTTSSVELLSSVVLQATKRVNKNIEKYFFIFFILVLKILI